MSKARENARMPSNDCLGSPSDWLKMSTILLIGLSKVHVIDKRRKHFQELFQEFLWSCNDMKGKRLAVFGWPVTLQLSRRNRPLKGDFKKPSSFQFLGILLNRFLNENLPFLRRRKNNNNKQKFSPICGRLLFRLHQDGNNVSNKWKNCDGIC